MFTHYPNEWIGTINCSVRCEICTRLFIHSAEFSLHLAKEWTAQAKMMIESKTQQNLTQFKHFAWHSKETTWQSFMAFGNWIEAIMWNQLNEEYIENISFGCTVFEKKCVVIYSRYRPLELPEKSRLFSYDTNDIVHHVV